MSGKTTKAASAPSGYAGGRDWQKHADDFLWVRETIESIVVAFLLAFLFRTFEAEPFVIPTGSMAPTLLGWHKDITSDATGYRFQANASMEFPEQAGKDAQPAFVLGVVDPISRFPEAIDEAKNPNHDSFCGDRILVSKFIYDFSEPQRWDVIVFKYPKDAKMNYIKRLIGLPNEIVRVVGGNIWAKPRSADDSAFRIQRKPDIRLLSMLQLVDDTHYIAPDLQKVNWPSKWQRWTPGEPIQPARSSAEDSEGLVLQSSAGGPTWMRYYQILPSAADWYEIVEKNRKPNDVEKRFAEPITDFAAYNATYDTQIGGGSTMSRAEYREYASQKRPSRLFLDPDTGKPVELEPEKLGQHWVGDLALELEVNVESDRGTLLLDLVKSGEHFQCKIDLSSGDATLSRSKGEFSDDEGKTKAATPVAKTSVRGKGRYKLRFSNIDDELRLWVNDRRASFNGPTTYSYPQKSRPHFSDDDPLDLAPLGIGVDQASVKVTRARVHRDIYYSATSFSQSEYESFGSSAQAARGARPVLLDPRQWETTTLFESMSSLDLTIYEDQFLPMGDNSAQSLDGRYWGNVDRHLLVGKALMVYWTHPWSRPYFWPEFGRIRFIR